MPNCVQCNQPMKLIPAGISKKTGNAYPAFWACPSKCKQEIPNPMKPTVQPTMQPAQPQPPITYKQDPDWEKINAEKQSEIHRSVAVNNACLLISTGKAELKDFIELSDKIYNYLQDEKQTKASTPTDDIVNIPF